MRDEDYLRHGFGGQYLAQARTLIRQRVNPSDRWWVYKLYGHEDTVLYIGYTAQRPERRIAQHLASPKGLSIQGVGLIPCQTREEALELEALFIERHQPPFNVAGVSFR